MKDYVWIGLFWGSLGFCGLEALSLLVAYVLFSTAPHNPHTSVIAIGFGFLLGFCGLGAMTMVIFDRISHRFETAQEGEASLVKKIIKETPFFFFALFYFFALAFFLGVFLLMMPYLQNAGSLR
ncbi:hypothetical protein HYY75_01980 [bacterium]|nr:hypothetical protein [bacterium]